MPSVPNTNTFKLSDVVAVVGGASLSAAFTAAAALSESNWDATYKGSKDRLLNFRNYTSTQSLVAFPFKDYISCIPPGGSYYFYSTLALAQQAWSDWGTYGGTVTGFNGYAYSMAVNMSVYLDANGSTPCGDGYYFWLDGSTWKRVHVVSGVITEIIVL
ncbi:MAG TPA: hypothetical protein DCR40_17990 [Prolixibacteraceae bacterium]|nr:hypothetical protein [Prolixibacteraceae bacterium]